MAKRPARKKPVAPGFHLFRLIPRHGAFPIALIVGLIAFGVALTAKIGWLLACVVGGNAMFVVYLAIVAIEVPHLTPEFLHQHADDENIPVWAIFLVTLAVVALCAFSLFSTLNGNGEASAMVIVASVASVLLGWFVIHTMAGFHYAYEYYESPEASPAGQKSFVGGFEWPKGETPNAVAFLYVSYQIGSALQIADVSTTSNRMRALVGAHIVFSFFYNTLLLAAVVNVVISAGGSGGA